jgi:hypothetical protein
VRKGINFKTHRFKEHNLWDYVSFIIYLKLTSEKMMTREEIAV